MSERKSDSATNQKSIGVDSRSVAGVKASRESEQALTRMRDIAVPDKRITGVRDSAGLGEVRKYSLDPDIIINTVKTVGEVAGSINNIGVTVGGAAYALKKGVDKIKGDKNKHTGTGDSSNKE